MFTSRDSLSSPTFPRSYLSWEVSFPSKQQRSFKPDISLPAWVCTPGTQFTLSHMDNRIFESKNVQSFENIPTQIEGASFPEYWVFQLLYGTL